MYNSDMPNRAELPSSAQLVRSTILAIGIAGVVLVGAVLPAEYGIDPTGVGRALGLTQMGEIKAHADAETAVPSAAPAQAPAAEVRPASAEPDVAGKTDTITITLAPNEGTEVKVEMVKGASLTYEWSAEGGVVNYDLHGEPFTDLNAVVSHKADKGVTGDAGAFEAPFDGRHGWFWRNRGTEPVTITLKVNGRYQNFKRLM